MLDDESSFSGDIMVTSLEDVLVTGYSASPQLIASPVVFTFYGASSSPQPGELPRSPLFRQYHAVTRQYHAVRASTRGSIMLCARKHDEKAGEGRRASCG